MLSQYYQSGTGGDTQKAKPVQGSLRANYNILVAYNIEFIGFQSATD